MDLRLKSWGCTLIGPPAEILGVRTYLDPAHSEGPAHLFGEGGLCFYIGREGGGFIVWSAVRNPQGGLLFGGRARSALIPLRVRAKLTSLEGGGDDPSGVLWAH